ncbi:MAG: PQQ-binding-like beta-propeller repeat protein, partial [Ginsengibacter sp.]
LYPSLVDLKKRMSETDVLNKIKTGGGKMPSFGSVISGHEKGIIDFLFDKTSWQIVAKENDLSEIKSNRASIATSKKENQQKDTAATYLNITAYADLKDPEGHPFIKQPWGTLNAINLNTGEYEWTIPAGNMPENQVKGAPVTGAAGLSGPIVTAGGLVFVGGSDDREFQAFDKSTGKLLWEIKLPGIASSTPCTYESNGKQYVAVSVSGNKEWPAGLIMSFSLPDK